MALGLTDHLAHMHVVVDREVAPFGPEYLDNAATAGMAGRLVAGPLLSHTLRLLGRKPLLQLARRHVDRFLEAVPGGLLGRVS